ncbi:GNAT family N-acetyltransferase [Corallococcus carmarthensis]|uniref:GNAT family N-acetyltransferase n=1 Tax=Corallococcus carmarthensis TaxID=2316728 RepID=A0A3A8K5U8_9BACT|nr:GNAT family N-acetyltransferase [Corallococcus carmarthensis]RKH02569.1 GNAT family N-acetyltransferase [Corallococcus carmarthensis]
MSTDVTNRVILREARPEDDKVIGDLLVEAYTTQYARLMPEVVYSEERKAFLRDIASRRNACTILVAEVDGEIAGTVALYPPDAPGSEAWLPRTADLRALATGVRFQGQGLAQPLLAETEVIAKRWGVDAISLHVRRGAKGVARMYERRGYQRVPEGDLERPDVYLEAYLLPMK